MVFNGLCGMKVKYLRFYEVLPNMPKEIFEKHMEITHLIEIYDFAFCRHVGTPFGSMATSWLHFGTTLEPHEAILEPLGLPWSDLGHLGASWDHLGVLWELPGDLWSSLGTLLELLGAVCGPM